MLNRIGIMLVIVVVTAGCELRQAMYNQARLKPLAASDFFKDGQGSRPLVVGTIPYGHLEEDDLFYRGTLNGKQSEVFPFAITEADLNAGRTQYEIFCSVCHGYSGNANGMIVQRGFKPPPSLHEDRLREAPVGYIFSVITNGFNVMPAYGKMIPHKERWQIIAYVRALQASQHMKAADLSPEERSKLDQKDDEAAGGKGHEAEHSQEHH